MSDAVKQNVEVAAIDLDDVIVVVSPMAAGERGGRGRGGVKSELKFLLTDLTENCDSPQIMCLWKKNESRRGCVRTAVSHHKKKIVCTLTCNHCSSVRKGGPKKVR